jgi:hypothetical protein
LRTSEAVDWANTGSAIASRRPRQSTCVSWQAEYFPEAKGLRLVGHQRSPRSHEIKDFLASNLIPYRWLDVAGNQDARVLLDAAGVGADELPVLFFEDGSVLRSPEPRQVAERLGRPISAAFALYDLVIVGAITRQQQSTATFESVWSTSSSMTKYASGSGLF